MTSFLGIDVGTTGCKVVAVDDQGIRQRGYEEGPRTIPEAGAVGAENELV